MRKRQIHRLSEAQVRNAKPKEITEPLSAAALAVLAGQAAALLGRRGIRSSAGDRLIGGLSLAQWKVVECELDHPEPTKRGLKHSVIIRDGKPILIRHSHTILNDGLGLLLQVSAADDGTIRKSWIFRYSVPEKITSKTGKLRQRQRWCGLGSADVLSLAQARHRAQQLRLMRLDGIDPITAKQGKAAAEAIAAAKAMTFDQAVDAYVADHGAKWGSYRHAQIWRKSLEQHVSPVFGSVPIQAIDKELVIKALRPLSHKHPETGMRVRGRIESVLAWAAAHGKRPANEQNPAQWKQNLEFVFPRRNQVAPVKHMPSLPFQQVPRFMADLRKIDDSIAARALEFTIMTVARSGTVLSAKWSEIDLENRLWTVPGAHMKTGKSFRCPLSDPVIVVLKALPRSDDHRIFPINDSIMRLVCKEVGGESVSVHGFRSSFSDWANETEAAAREVIEESLAHVVGSVVERAYRRDDLLPRRRVLLNQWSAFCSGETVLARGTG